MKEKILFTVLVLSYSCSTKHEATKPVEQRSRYDSLFEITCRHTELSRSFDIDVQFKRHMDTKSHDDSCVVMLLLSDKLTGQRLDSISVVSKFYFENVFKTCSTVRSYTTKTNIDSLVADNYYGDIVVADLNFDGRDDVAVINDSGGNGGTFYSYYLQEADRQFIYNPYLTDSMTYFPEEINIEARTLRTYVHAGVCGLGEHIYQFDKADGSWTQVSHRIIDICK